MAMAAQPVAHGGPFTRADLDRMPQGGRRYEIIGRYREVAAVRGEEPFEATEPFPVTVVPAHLVR